MPEQATNLVFALLVKLHLACIYRLVLRVLVQFIPVEPLVKEWNWYGLLQGHNYPQHVESHLLPLVRSDVR